MGCCNSGTETLFYGNWNYHACRKGKCEVDRPYVVYARRNVWNVHSIWKKNVKLLLCHNKEWRQPNIWQTSNNTRIITLKVSAHSFKGFTSRLLKLSFSLYAPITSDVMLDFIWTLPVQLRGTRNKWTLQKILSTVGFDPPTPHSLQIISPPLSPLGHNSLDMRWN